MKTLAVVSIFFATLSHAADDAPLRDPEPAKPLPVQVEIPKSRYRKEPYRTGGKDKGPDTAGRALAAGLMLASPAAYAIPQSPQ